MTEKELEEELESFKLSERIRKAFGVSGEGWLDKPLLIEIPFRTLTNEEESQIPKIEGQVCEPRYISFKVDEEALAKILSGSLSWEDIRKFHPFEKTWLNYMVSRKNYVFLDKIDPRPCFFDKEKNDFVCSKSITLTAKEKESLKEK